MQPHLTHYCYCVGCPSEAFCVNDVHVRVSMKQETKAGYSKLKRLSVTREQIQTWEGMLCDFFFSLPFPHQLYPYMVKSLTSAWHHRKLIISLPNAHPPQSSHAQKRHLKVSLHLPYYFRYFNIDSQYTWQIW